MAGTNFRNLVFNLRFDSKQKALQEALRVPWRELEKSSAAYGEWHIFLLWVRAISETSDEVPEILRSELRARCPSFFESESRQRDKNRPVWQSLQEWLAAHHFAKPKTEGWFNAVMFYAYQDLRTEQAWSLWQRTKAAWHQNPPSRWPTFEEWTADVLATWILAHQGTEKARAVEALAKVDRRTLQNAVSDLLDRRAFALWVDCVSKPKQPLDESVLNEVRKRGPRILTASAPDFLWLPSLFSRLVRFGESHWCAAARAEGWYAALRYHVVHHPRYQRLIHYQQRCHDEWLRVRPISYPSFPDWLSAADAYCIEQTD